MNDVDEEFRVAVALLVPAMLHDLAFHAHVAERIARHAECLGALMGSRARQEHVCWTIAREAAVLPGLRRARAATTAEDGVTAKVMDIDNAAPLHRAVTRFVQCAIDDDHLTGAAVFETVPDDEIESFARTLLWNVGRAIRFHQPSECRP